MQKQIKILSIVGARPNFIKITPLLEEFKKHREIKSILVHTGQHYDFEMSKIFFQDLKIRSPKYDLEVGSGSRVWQTAKIMERLEPILVKEKPGLVIVVGDVNSTLAGALTASALHIPIAHIEAGCRSFDTTMPEEINRLIVDHISDFLFTASYFEDKNLLDEGITKNKIFCVGNIMTDTLLKSKIKFQKSETLEKLKLEARKYAVLTLHRAGNVDNRKRFREISGAVKKISREITILFPMHPRTLKMAELFGLKKNFEENPKVIITKPLSYPDMMTLVKNSRFVLTDSGGLQHETTVLGVPCLTINKTTGWPITITQGSNKIIGTSEDNIIKESFKLLSRKIKRNCKLPQYWDGKTSPRIVKIILGWFPKK